jgi:hypothetical protein
MLQKKNTAHIEVAVLAQENRGKKTTAIADSNNENKVALASVISMLVVLVKCGRPCF